MSIRQANEVKMRAHYKAWVASGQSLKGYSRANDIDYKKLHYWYEKIQSQDGPVSPNDIISPINNPDPSKDVISDQKDSLTSFPNEESSNELMIGHCTYCHKSFQAFRIDTQYCSSSCKQMSYVKRREGFSNDFAPANAVPIEKDTSIERSSLPSFKQITLTPDPVVSFVEIHYPSGVIVKLNQAVNLEMLKIFL